MFAEMPHRQSRRVQDHFSQYRVLSWSGLCICHDISAGRVLPGQGARVKAVQRARPILLAVMVVAAVLIGRIVRQEAGLGGSVESVQAWVATLGWRAPAAYLGVVTFRLFLFLPSVVVLPVGGLLFGLTLGTILGTAGILISAAIGFGVSRGIGRRWVRDHLERRHRELRDRAERAGPLLVGLVTAHPMGPMSAFHWGAGLVKVPVASFLFAVAIGGLVRAATLSFFGSTLVDFESWQFFVASAVLVTAATLPLAHRGFRQWVFTPRTWR